MLKTITAIIILLPLQSFAVGLGQKDNAIKLNDMEVVASSAPRNLTSPTIEQARAKLEQIPGAIGFVEAEIFMDEFAQSLGDTLVFTPGVYADTSAQRENRISIRGSGLNSSFERRGITVFRDGIPITRASGSTEFQEVDPTSIRYIEVYKGANAFRYGATALGGAINIVTPTGLNSEDTFKARFEGGSFNSQRLNLSYANAVDNIDYYVGVTGLHSDGFRDHSDVESAYSFANIGIQLSDRLETRFYYTGLSDNFELAGSVSLEDALTNRKQSARAVTAGPVTLANSAIEDDWDRNLDVLRLANKTAFKIKDNLQLEGGLWYSYRDLDHAITSFAGIINQIEDEYGAYSRLTGNTNIASFPFNWTLGGQVNIGDNDAKTFANVFGKEGALRTHNDQDSENLAIYLETDIALSEKIKALAGVQYNYATRSNDVIFDSSPGPGAESYNQINPRFGLLWTPTDSAQHFFNISRSFEPPAMSDLTAGGALDFTPLEAQDAWTVELGTRGQTEYFSWDLAIYKSWIENELIDVAAPGFGAAVTNTTNANDTIHQGLEAGIDLFIAPSFIKDNGLDLIWRNVITINDFNFDNDATYNDNTLAGVPDALYVTELRLDSDKWYAGVNVRWVPNGPYADYANTFQVDGFELLGFTAGLDITNNISLYVSGENMLDKNYISNVTTIADRSQDPNSTQFTPGQGRAVFAGINISLF